MVNDNKSNADAVLDSAHQDVPQAENEAPSGSSAPSDEAVTLSQAPLSSAEAIAGDTDMAAPAEDAKEDAFDVEPQGEPSAEAGQSAVSGEDPPDIEAAAEDAKEDASEVEPQGEPSAEAGQSAVSGEDPSDAKAAAEDAKEDVSDDSTEEGGRTEDGPALPDDQEKESEPRANKKSGGFGRFLKKYKLPIIIAVLAVLIAAAVTTVVLINNAPKIFIDSASDFAAAPKKNKAVYVLKKDVTVDGDLVLNNALDLNLNGHTLTVNGTFKRTVDGEADMNIGTLKKKQYVSGGKLKVSGADITAPDGVLSIYCGVEISGIARLKQLNLYNDAVIRSPEKLSLTGTKVVIHKNAEGEISLKTGGALLLNAGAALDRLTADDLSSAVIFGKINQSIVGGEEISLLGAASCPEVRGAATLYYQQATVALGIASDIGNVLIVAQLDTPSELTVERRGTEFKCVASKVNNADSYVFTIKEGDKLIKELVCEDSVCDVTEYINQPKVYTVSVKAIGADPRISLPSQELSITYNYTVKLDSPMLSIARNSDDEVILSFPKVDFAKVYRVEISGEKFSVDDSGSPTVSADITRYVEAAGGYTIKVTAANPANSSFIDSDTVFASHITLKKLDAPEISIEKEGSRLKISWQAVRHAKTYVLSHDGRLTVTTSTAVLFELADIADNTEFTLFAAGIGYYEKSDAAERIYEFPALVIAEQPEFSFDGDILEISMPAVPSAQSYTLLINDEEIGTSAEPIFSAEATAGDIVAIRASADYYKDAVSAPITVAVSEE